MLFGMGTVFVFLALLVFATTAMSTLVNRFSAKGSSVESEVNEQHSNQVTTPQIVKAIEKAIAAHRTNK